MAARDALEVSLALARLRVPKARAVLRAGLAAHEVLAAAREHGADLLLVGTHGRKGLARWILGSVAEKIARKAEMPVMIVSARERVRPTRRLKDVFRADHQRIERVVLRLLAAFEANDREDIARLWTELDTGLLLHFAVEEKSILPELLLRSPRDAGVIVSEHRHLRARLAELGVSIDLHLVRLEIARHFVEELRAHALSEERILYGSSDTVVGERERRSTLRALEGEAASTATAPENHHPRL